MDGMTIYGLLSMINDSKKGVSQVSVKSEAVAEIINELNYVFFSVCLYSAISPEGLK